MTDHKIIVSFVRPPIPNADHYCAYSDDLGADDSPYGTGPCAPKAHTCKVCGVEVPSYRTMCQRHAEQARLRKADQIEETNWIDPVHLDGAPGGWGEGYFADTDDLRESCKVYDVEVPAYCWPCTSQPLRLDPERLLERAVDDMHEAAADQIVDADGLCEFIEAWNAKQTCVTWYPDHSHVVVLDRARFDALLAAPGRDG